MSDFVTVNTRVRVKNGFEGGILFKAIDLNLGPVYMIPPSWDISPRWDVFIFRPYICRDGMKFGDLFEKHLGLFLKRVMVLGLKAFAVTSISSRQGGISRLFLFTWRKFHFFHLIFLYLILLQLKIYI